MERRSARTGYRPTVCETCRAPLNQAKRGRPRFTCSDRCRQIKRRQDWHAGKARYEKEAWRRAEREVRKLEKRLGGPGSLDIPIVPGDMSFTLRMRVLIRFARREEVPFCQVCGKPYIIDTYRHYPACKGRCSRVYGERQRAVESGLQRYYGQYDARVDVRRRLTLPLRACKHCGKPFPNYYSRQIYCSKKCNNNAWYARHPQRTCKVCGTSFRGKSKFCSERCRDHLRYHTAVCCARCEHRIRPGCEIPPNEDTRLPKRLKGSRWDTMPVVFCSARCRDALGWSPSSKTCNGCGEMFYPTSKVHQRQQKYCSLACGRRNRERMQCRVQYDAKPPKVCRRCGQCFKPRFRAAGRPIYCSKECSHAARLAQRAAARAAKRATGIQVQMPWMEWEQVETARESLALPALPGL